MHDGDPHHGLAMADDENISGTFFPANGEDSAETGPDEANEGCVFIEPYTWPAGFPPFCGRLVLPGSPYCPAHAALCAGPAAKVRR